MDPIPIPTAELPNPNQQPINSQPTSEELNINEATHELVATIPIEVPEANTKETGSNIPEEIEREPQESGHPKKNGGDIIDLDDEEESRKCELPKEMCKDSENRRDEKPPLEVCEQSEHLLNNISHEKQTQEIGLTNTSKENSLVEEEKEKSEKEQPALEEQKEKLINEELVEEIEKEKKGENAMISEEVSIREQVEIPKEIPQAENKEIVPKESNIDIEETNNLKQIVPTDQQIQILEKQVLVNESLPLASENENCVLVKNGGLNSPNEPMIDENKECAENNGHHKEVEKDYEIRQNLDSINDKNPESENLDESVIILESLPEQEKINQGNTNHLSESLPILIEENQKNDVPQKEILEVAHDKENKFIASETHKFDKVDEKVSSEVVKKPESEKPKETNEVTIDADKIIGENGEKNVKKIKELLLASLSGDFAETLLLMSDEEILKIFEEIQAEEGKKEDEKKQTEENLKTKESKSSPQSNNNTSSNKKPKGIEETKDISKQNTHQSQNNQKNERPELDVSNNHKSIPSKKEVGNGSSKLFSENVGEGDKFEESKEGTREDYQKKIPAKKPGSKKKIVTTIIQQVEYLEDEDKQEESLGKYRKNEKGESKRVVKKEKMNTILSQISNLVHELNFQDLEDQEKQ